MRILVAVLVVLFSTFVSAQSTVDPPTSDFEKPIVVLEVWDGDEVSSVVVEELSPIGNEGVGGFPGIAAAPHFTLHNEAEAAAWVYPSLDPTTVYDRSRVTVRYFARPQIIPASAPNRWNVRRIVFRRGHNESLLEFDRRQRAMVMAQEEQSYHETEHCGRPILETLAANCPDIPEDIASWFMQNWRSRPQLVAIQLKRESPFGGMSSKWMAWIYYPGGEMTLAEFRTMVEDALNEEWHERGWHQATAYEGP